MFERMKERVKGAGHKVAAVAMAPITVLAAMSTSWASSEPSSSVVGYDAVEELVTAMSTQISVTNIIGVLAGVLGATIGLVFMWWAARKLVRKFMGAFRSGRTGV